MFSYQGHNIEIINWPAIYPWPDEINYDGVLMRYANSWANISGKQIIYYAKPGRITKHGIDRRKFIDETEFINRMKCEYCKFKGRKNKLAYCSLSKCHYIGEIHSN